jgi:hypothetical protein
MLQWDEQMIEFSHFLFRRLFGLVTDLTNKLQQRKERPHFFSKINLF